MAIPTELPTELHFREMNRAMALVLLEECYDRAVDDKAPLSAKMDLLKLNVKLGDLEPKQTIIPAGNGFQINFVFSGSAPAGFPQGTTIDATPTLVVEHELKSEPVLPEYLKKIPAPKMAIPVPAGDD